MRFVEGQDLKTILERDGKLAPERALDLLGQVAGALDAAHRRALVHRDVKPANVLLDEDDHVYLTDFGITKQLGGASTDTDRVVGTLDYLAPEQIRGDPVDGRTDCYALGCVLYECLAGRAPFRRATEAETLWAHMQEEPASLRGHPKLDPVLRKALAKDREDRYRSCAELIEAAAGALGLEHARRPRRPVLPARRRHGRLLLAGGLLLAVATIGGGRSRPWAETTRGGRRPGQRRGGHRGRRHRAGVVHRDADCPEQPRGGRGRGLGAEPRGPNGHAHRPRHQEGRRASHAARRARSTSQRAPARMGAAGRRPLAHRPAHEPDHPHHRAAGGRVRRGPRLPELGLRAGGRRGRRGLGDQPRPHRLQDRSGQRPARGDDRRGRRHDRRRARGRVVHRRRRHAVGHPDRPADQPRWALDTAGRAEPLGGSGGRRLRVGIGGGRRARLADRARAEAGLEDDRRGRGRDLPRLSTTGPYGPRTTATARCRAST